MDKLKTLRISKPRHFSLANTLKIIQRGKCDPINIINDGQLKRIISTPEGFSYVNIFETNNYINIKISCLKGRISNLVIKNEIHKILGLDDPLIHDEKTDFDCRKYNRIQRMKSASLPCYASHYENLIQTILGQQVSAIVANRVRSDLIKKYGRKIKICDCYYYIFPNAENMSKANVEDLRNIGMSLNKAKAIISISDRFCDKTWIQEITSASKSSTDIIKMLTDVKGIGPWTASWFLIRGLRKFDFIPSTDLIIRKAMSWWWGKPEILEAPKIDEIASKMGKHKGIISYRIMLAYMTDIMKQGIT